MNIETVKDFSIAFTAKMKTWFNPNNCFPVLLNVMFFLLYILCFVSLYKPNLEIIGFGMFFALHVMMGISMLKILFQKGTEPKSNPGKRFEKMTDPFSFENIINNIKILFSDYILIGKISITTTITLVFVSFIMIFLTFRKLRAKHKLQGIQPRAGFIPEHDQYKGATEKTGYEYRGESKYGKETWKYGYYLIDGVDYFMNDDVTIKMKDKFKDISIAITVLLWVIYATVTNGEISKYICSQFYLIIISIFYLPIMLFISKVNKSNFKQNVNNFLTKYNTYRSFIIIVQTVILCIAMLVLSSINIWFAQKIGVRNNAIADPSKKINRNKVGPDDTRLSIDRTPAMGPIYVPEYTDYKTKNKCPNGTIKTIDNKNGMLECTPDQRMSVNNFNNWTPPPAS
jgi:hypothetical protein